MLSPLRRMTTVCGDSGDAGAKGIGAAASSDKMRSGCRK